MYLYNVVAVKDSPLSENQAPWLGKHNPDPVEEIPTCKDGSQGPEPDEQVLGPDFEVHVPELEDQVKAGGEQLPEHVYQAHIAIVT